MMVEIIDPDTKEVWNFHVDKKLQAFLESRVKKLIQKRDKDYVMLIDGYEGSGKSTFGMQMARYVDPSLKLTRVCMTADEFKAAILGAKKAECVIYDEAVTGLTAGDSITRIGRLLKSMMMQMRQKNLFVIVILPTVFELNKYAILSRARFFFHIHEVSGRMGYWVGFNRKDLRNLYIKGKKTYSYRVWSRFSGRFYGKYVLDEEGYRKKKEEALLRLEDTDEISEGGKWGMERRILLANLFLYVKEKEKMSQEEFCKRLEMVGIKMNQQNVSFMVAKTEKEGKITLYQSLNR